jgi:serine/threonine protein kinase
MNKRFCERCERVTQDGHLWCSDRDCPAEQGYPVFDYGDYVADVKIDKIIAVWRTGVLYTATRNDKPVWIKVAHRDDECEARLKREAKLLQAIAPQQPSFLQTFSTQPRINYLHWFPPYPGKSEKAYGEVTVNEQTRVYCVYKAISGSLLRDALLENKYPWHTEAAGIVTTIASAMRIGLDKGLVHLGLTPDMIYVDKDAEGHLRATLIDLGWCLRSNDLQGFDLKRIFKLVDPAYAAPEVLAQLGAQAVTPAADAYSLGSIFYEMLAGEPYFSSEITRDDKLRQRVVSRRAPILLKRPELAAATVPTIVEQAVSPQKRFSSVLDLQGAVVKVYGVPPREKLPRPVRYYMFIGILGMFFTAIIIAGLYVLLQALLR